MEFESSKTEVNGIGQKGDFAIAEKIELNKKTGILVKFRLEDSIKLGHPIKKFHNSIETGTGFTSPVVSIMKKSENQYLVKMSRYVSHLVTFGDNIGEKDSLVFISQIVGSKPQGGRVFIGLKVLTIDEPIRKNFPLFSNQERVISTIEEIEPQFNNLFVVKTANRLYYEVVVL